MTEALNPRSTRRIVATCIVAAATVFLLGDDLAAGRGSHAVLTVAVVVGWALLWSGTLREPGTVDDRGAIGLPLLDRLDRIATALERAPSRVVSETPKADLARLGTAIAEKQWEVADALLDEHRDDPEVARLGDRLASAKVASGDGLLGELKAAQEVSDPGRVLEIREQLAPLIASDRLKELDSQLAKWFMGLVMRRLRTGSVQTDVAELVARVADRFGQTTEGASLRASLPTLRRSAGLCARCARPYRGISDACPVCLAPPSPDPEGEAPVEDEEVEEFPASEERLFVDPLDPL